MTLARILPYAIVLATGACVKQGTVKSDPAPQVDLFKLCSDPHFESACTPAQPQQTTPVRVDTNLATPLPAPFAG